MERFFYEDSDLVEEPVSWDNINSNLTKFDRLLQTKWNAAKENGAFRYSLDDCEYKTLRGEGEHGPMSMVAQLNLHRASNRRCPELFETMNEPFAGDKFNFTKIRPGERLLELCRRSGGGSDSTGDGGPDATGGHHVIVNVSPIDDCHVLLVPSLDACLPQRATAGSLLLAFDLLQLSSQPGFRVGFNSLHAYASINHLHFHAMHCRYPLFIDDFPASRQIAKRCYLLDEHAPMPAFVFPVPSEPRQRREVAAAVQTLVDLFHEREIPYTLVVTRGGGTRAVAWPRASSAGVEASDFFHVACVEAAGQLPIRTRRGYDVITFDLARRLLRDHVVSGHVFDALVRDFVARCDA